MARASLPRAVGVSAATADACENPAQTVPLRGGPPAAPSFLPPVRQKRHHPCERRPVLSVPRRVRLAAAALVLPHERPSRGAGVSGRGRAAPPRAGAAPRG